MSVMVSSTNYSFSFSVSLNYKDNTSVDRVDYLPMVFNVDFSAEQERATFEVPTIDDNIAELTETFTIVIVNTTVPDQVMTGEPHTASVNLIDDDGMPGQTDNIIVCFNYQVHASPLIGVWLMCSFIRLGHFHIMCNV